jgi:enoyl-CoA hydratase
MHHDGLGGIAEHDFMAYECLLYEKQEGVGTVTFHRPKELNALNRRSLEELESVLEEARVDDQVRVLILTGSGDKAFVAGADINELAQKKPLGGRDTALYGQRVFRRLETLGKPSIAAINGYALGGGCELALACSIRLASRTAKLGQPEVKLGIMPGYGGSQRLTRLCGPGVANEMCLTGEMISAEEALRIGLVNHVYEPGELLAAAGALAKKIAANAPIAVRFAAEAIGRSADLTLDEGLALEATLFSLCCATEDMREGTQAFLEKRAARFQGK